MAFNLNSLLNMFNPRQAAQPPKPTSTGTRITSYNDYSTGPGTLLGAYQQNKPVFQGPVRPGDDEAHFRSTGQTRPIQPSPTPTPRPSAPAAPKPAAPPATKTAIQANPDAYTNDGRLVADIEAEREATRQAQLQSEVDEQYGDIDNFLQSLYNQEGGSLENFQKAASSPYDAQLPGLGQARDEALSYNSQQQDSEKYRQAGAMSEARGLFNELQQANRQRFGSSSSAGEFSSQLQGREFQRQQGKLQDVGGQNIRALEQKSQDIRGQYQAQVQSIEQQKAAALSQAQLAYQQRVDSINNARVANQQNKAAMQIEALREFNANRSAIENQSRQYMQQVQMQAQSADEQLRNAVLAYREQAGQSVDLNNLPDFNFSSPQGTQTAAAAPLTGIRRRPEDILAANPLQLATQGV